MPCSSAGFCLSRHSGCPFRLRFAPSFCHQSPLSALFEIRPELRIAALWGRLEKGAENMLKRVDQFSCFLIGQPTRGSFSEILTIGHLERSSANPLRDWSFRGIHRFTAIITTTSLIRFQV